MNKRLSGSQIRQIWLDFFKSKKHEIVESKSLVPINDPSLLWINAGVATLKKFFSGEENPINPRLANSQRCIRANDIENVGVTSRHHTIFEMLGNFSIGDYFKKEAIQFGFELLTKEYGLDKDKLYITVYHDDNDAYDNWVQQGIDPKHIIKCNKERNFWDLGSGPCGPCTEIYYDRGEKYDPKKLGEKLFFEDIENDRYIEVWNIVFSQFNNDGKNNYSELLRKNIDTGASLERFASVLQDVPTNYDTDLFLPIIREIEKYTDSKYVVEDYFSNDKKRQETLKAFRVIADHLKCGVFAIADGVLPGPKDRDYIIRKLLRRAFVYARKLDAKPEYLQGAINKIIEIYGDFFKHLLDNKKIILEAITNESNNFSKTLDYGFDIFNQAKTTNGLTAEIIFKLVETYGFPLDLIKELSQESNIKIDIEGFEKLFKKHQEVSKANSNETGMKKQNENLLKFDKESKFHYDKNNIKTNVIAIFDDNFNPVDKIEVGSGYVVFKDTPIYATSGGQRYDEGYCIKKGDLVVHFDNVIKAPNKQHLHHFNKASFWLDEKVELIHDENWRRLVRKNHSLEHILHATLKNTISETIKQSGAFKSAAKATLDFNYPSKLTDEEIENVESKIRKVIADALPVGVHYVDYETSQKMNAIAYFEEEYKKHELLRVIKMEDYSVELCGGTHVNNTKEIEDCFITDLYSLGAGRWRIEIISSHETIQDYLISKQEEIIKEKAKMIDELGNYPSFSSNEFASIKEIGSKINNFSLPNSIKDLRKSLREFEELKEEFKKNKLELDKKKTKDQANKIKQIALNNLEHKIVLLFFDKEESKALSIAHTELVNEKQDHLFFFINKIDNKISYLIGIKNPTDKLNAKILIEKINKTFEAKGGGKPNFAQGGFSTDKDIDKLKTDFINLCTTLL
ncbi:alanine--tRNA ligase [Mycoplasma bradburyae]|uniref:Alanine--tRNA ligase n=1 Tax=Mycoplasma bradburyae TaxID=2963128 RepID=A0AAW6HS91_9MOLU|nr:alanine--tRNA ligase [Mycoplasma bradburyae]MDC4183648.1 alanine--tRNA ligase [Mycoplasma bradburyae]UTS70956.1 alanine--tRNA ligase [Mycoplasma bradburyae]